MQSPVPGCQYYNYNEVDRFEAALHAVDQWLKNENQQPDLQNVDRILKIIYSFCVDAIDQISSSLCQYLIDGGYLNDLIDETEALLLMIVENCWTICCSRESAVVLQNADKKQVRLSEVLCISCCSIQSLL
jgi:hypothetical protein